MAIKVRSSWNGEEYLLLGAGYSFQAAAAQPSSSLLLGTPARADGHVEMVIVCDREGTIHWVRSQDIEVIEVDGKPPEGWLK